MTIGQQRCWNHEAREAVCRCPECRRSFCRECVSEHGGRLLCATCLRHVVHAAASSRGRGGRLRSVMLTAAGVVVAWAVFLGAAESLLTITERSERMQWQGR